MKKMKHGGKARKTHKRMQDGGMADYGEAARPMAYSRGKVGTSAFRPVGRPDMPSSPDRGGSLKPGMRPLASSEAYMRKPGRGGQMGGESFSDIQGVGGGGLSKIVGGGDMGRPVRGGAMPAVEQGMSLNVRPGRGGSATQRASFDAQPARGGAMPSMEEAQTVRLPGRGSAMSAVEQGLGLRGRPGRVGSAIQRASFDAQPAPRPVFRPGTNIRDALKASSDYLTQNPQYMTSTARPAAPMAAEAAAPAFRKGGAVKGKKMRGGGLARKGVGMALAKGGLAKRAGGCAKRGVGRGKMV